MRLLRLAVFNAGGRHTAKVKLVPGTSTIRLTVYPSVKDMGFAPGAHYFIYFLDRWAFWESHPFTAAGWRPANPGLEKVPAKIKHLVALQKFDDSTAPNSPRTTNCATTTNSNDKEIELLRVGHAEKVVIDKIDKDKNRRSAIYITTTTTAPVDPAHQRQRAKLIFLIHARRGMTRNLLKRLQESPGHTLILPCLLEGPYGIARPVQCFPTVMIISGGVGVSTALPYLQQQLAKEVQVTRRFVMIWSVRDGTMAEKLLTHIRGLENREDIVVKIYITRSSTKDTWRLPVGVKVRYRRPNIEDLILRESKSRTPGTPMALVACGGGAVVDCARRGAVKALEGAAGKGGTGELVYWEEGYGW